ncbi:MAG: hypothetical protein ACPL5I_12395, partial [Thermodesulfobacteriota bacterium]
ILKAGSYYLCLSGIGKYVRAVLCGEQVGKREMVIFQPILISPLPLPPVSCWQEILKLLDGQGLSCLNEVRISKGIDGQIILHLLVIWNPDNMHNYFS